MLSHITRRLRTALVPLVAVLALTAALAALALSLDVRRRLSPAAPTPGRLVSAAPTDSYRVEQPIDFLLDDFWLMKQRDGSFVALYLYPAGYPGHVRGCSVRWEPEKEFELPPTIRPAPSIPWTR